ncbi:MAG: GTP-binding protein, partial [Muribaculaceae bacterium]|nr:GTP-binding protein [Muribaculaceae bacterium]
MRIYKTNEIKNIALIGAKGSGKTTLTEAMLFECGVIKRRGTIEGNNTVSDYFPVEKEYGYSVFSTVFNAEFNNKKLNIIDCPGSDDFVGNAYTAMGVTDLALLLIDAENGVEVGTENIFRTTANLKKPVVFALNQMDGEKADYDNVLEQLKEHFGSKVIPIQYPLESGPGFKSIIDVLIMKKLEWGPDGGAPVISEIPADQMEKASELNKILIEAAAENDETLMEKFFDQGVLTEDEMREGIRKGLVDRSILPVVVLSAAKDMGVRRLMEFLGNVCPFVDEMPAPVDTAGEEVRPDSNGPLSVFFFKTSVEPHIGEVCYFKVMSGTLKA